MSDPVKCKPILIALVAVDRGLNSGFEFVSNLHDLRRRSSLSGKSGSFDLDTQCAAP